MPQQQPNIRDPQILLALNLGTVPCSWYQFLMKHSVFILGIDSRGHSVPHLDANIFFFLKRQFMNISTSFNNCIVWTVTAVGPQQYPFTCEGYFTLYCITLVLHMNMYIQTSKFLPTERLSQYMIGYTYG